MASKEKSIEEFKELITQNLVMKEYFKRLYDENSMGLVYKNDIELPANIKFTAANFIKVTPKDGPPFFLEEDDFYRLLKEKKEKIDRKW